MKTLLAAPILWAALLLAAGGCKKNDLDPNGLPKATQEGKNTAGFLLNSQPWRPAKDPNYPGTPFIGAYRSSNFYQGNKRLNISFGRYKDDNDISGLTFYFQSMRGPGTFQLNQDINPAVISGPRPPYGFYDIDRPRPARKYYTGSGARGQVIVTRFDTVARVVSGTFEATVKENGGAETLTITDGRFDLTF